MAKILAVDDSASMRQMVSFTLKGAGHEVVEAADGKQALEKAKGMQVDLELQQLHEVVEAADGKQALEKAKGMQVDLVLSDVNMPVMDGLTLVKELRALPSYKFTPILMLTTESTGDKKMAGKQAGATGWLVKPFNPDQLLATIKKVLG